VKSIVDAIRGLTNDARSDQAILFEWGNRVIDERRDDIFAEFPEDRDRYFQMRRELRDSPLQTFWTGLKSGVTDQLPKLATDLGELAMRGANAVLPDVDIGSMQESKNLLDQGADWMAKQSAEQEAEAASKRDPWGVASLEQAQAPSDYFSLGSRMVGENVPQLALSLIPGAAAGRVAQGAARAAGMADIAGLTARGIVTGAADTAAVESAAAASGLKAAASAAYISNALQNTADIYSGLDEKTKSSGKGITTAIGGGAIAGALDTLGEALPLNRMFPGMHKKFFAPVVANVLERGGVRGAIGNAIATGSMEAVTEALQEGVAIASEEYAQGIELPDDVIASRMKNAGFGGGALGLLLGGAAGGFNAQDLRPTMEGPKPGDADFVGPTIPTTPNSPEFIGPPQPRPSIYSDEFIGPNLPGPQPGDPNFTGPVQQPPGRNDPDFIGPVQPGPAPGTRQFIGPMQPPPAPGSPEFMGPMLPPPSPGDRKFIGPTQPTPKASTRKPAAPAPAPAAPAGQLDLGFDNPAPIDTPAPALVKAVADDLGLATTAVVNPNVVNATAKKVEAKNALQKPKPASVPQAQPPGSLPEVAQGGGAAAAPAEEVAPQENVRIAADLDVLEFTGLDRIAADPASGVTVDNSLIVIPPKMAKGIASRIRKLVDNPDSKASPTVKKMALKFANDIERQSKDILKGAATAAPTSTTAAPQQAVSVAITPEVAKIMKLDVPPDPSRFEGGVVPPLVVDSHAKIQQGTFEVPADMARYFAAAALDQAKNTAGLTPKQKKALRSFARDITQQADLISNAPAAPKPQIVGDVAGQPVVGPAASTKKPAAPNSNPTTSNVRIVGKDSPLPTKTPPVFGYLFKPEDGDSDSRMRQAAGSATGKSNEKLRRRAVLLLDRATGQVISRHIWTNGAESTEPGKGIRVELGQRRLSAKDKGYAGKGSAAVDFQNGHESTGWAAMKDMMHRGQPRFEPIGFLHFSDTQAANFNMPSMADLNGNPAMERAFKVLYNPPADMSPQDLKELEDERSRRGGVKGGPVGQGTGKGGKTELPLENLSKEDLKTASTAATEPADTDDGEQRAAKLKTLAKTFLALMKATNNKPSDLDLDVFATKFASLRGFESKKDVAKAKANIVGLAKEPKALINLLQKTVKGWTNATVQKPSAYLASIPEAHAMFSHALATLQRNKVDVFLASAKFLEAITGEANARGVHIPMSNGKAIIGLVTNYLSGNITTDEVVRLYHEAAHPFIDKLPVWQQQMFQNAITNLPWQEQAWLSTGYGMDARVIANTPREELLPEQRAMFDAITPQEMAVLRGTDPSTLILERSVEHLAALGIDGFKARDIMSQIIRFVKGIMLRIAVETQRLLKGEANVSENLARAFVENKWLQFINQDFAASPGAISTSFAKFIGAPQTDAERVAVYDNINGEAQNFYYTPGTGFRETIPPSTETTSGLLAYHNIMAHEKNLGQMVKLMTLGKAIPQDALQYLTGGMQFEDLSLDNQMKILAVAQKELDAIPVQKNKKGQLLAPNGQPSELPEMQWKMVRTNFFKRWFGDWQAGPEGSSKVINPVTLEPRIVYHGTPAENQFTVFSIFHDLGHHFGDQSEANNRIGYSRIQNPAEGEQFKFEKSANYWNPPRSSDRIIPVFLNIKNPAQLTDNDWIQYSGLVRMVQNKVITQDQAERIFATDNRQLNADAVRAALVENGFDGGVYQNAVEGDQGNEQTWIAFDSEQIKDTANRVFTPSKRMNLTVQIGESVDPTIETNTRFATINHIRGVVSALMQDPEIRRTLPKKFVKDGQNSFENLALGMSKADTTEQRTKALTENAGTQKDLTTNQPFQFDPATLINQLPATTEGSSAQQRAMRDALIQMQKIQTKLVKKIDRARKNKTKLEVIQNEKKRALTPQEVKELDALNTDIPVYEKALALENVGINAQVDRLRGKLRTGFLFQVTGGAKYYVPPTDTATAAQVYTDANTKEVPANLYHETPASQQLARDLGKMQMWLDNPVNRDNGDLYETVSTQFRKLSEAALDPAYTSRRARLKKTVFDSIANMLKGVGTPPAQYLASRFYALDSMIARWTGDAEALGSKWSTLYGNIKREMNLDLPDAEFRQRVYNPLMAIAIATPDGTVDPYSKTVAAYNATRPAAHRINDKSVGAVKEMLRATLNTESHETKMFDSAGSQVQDEKLGKDGAGRIRQRGLIRQGFITGRISISKFFDSMWADMAPLWTNTAPTTSEDAEGNEVEEINPLFNAPDLWKQGVAEFGAQIAKYFEPSTMRNFVEPLMYGNKQIFLSPSSIATDTKILASQANVRAAWEASKNVAEDGDITTFIAELNRLEGGDSATEAEFAGLVMKSFTNMFAKVHKVANERAQADQNMGIPVLPEEIMNARTAEDFPPEWVDYALYDQGSNKVVLHSLALNYAFGRDGLTSGDFSKNVASVVTELKAMKREYDALKIDRNMTDAEVKSIMGADRYGIAISATDHLQMMANIKNKMRFLVDPLSTQQGDLRLADEILGFMAGATIQSIRSSLQNTLDVLGPLYRQKFSTTALRAIKDSIKFGASDAISGLMQWFGIHTHFIAGFANRNRELGARDPDNYRSWRDAMSDFGTNNSLAADDTEQRIAPKWNATGIRLLRRAKSLINASPLDVGKELVNKAMGTDFVPNIPGDQALAPKLRALGIFKSTSMYISNGIVFGQYNAYKDVVMRGLQFINSSADPQGYAQKLVDGEIKFTPEQLGYARKWLLLNDRAAFDYMADAVATKMGQGSLERMVGDAWKRTQRNPNEPVITDEQFARIRSVALSDVQLASTTTNTPADMRSNAAMRAFSTFLTWPYTAMTRFPALFQTAQGQYTAQAALDGAMTLMWGVIPLTLAASMGIDWYDEELLGKKQNIRDIGADSLVPGLGAIAYPMATLERLARYGTGGLASEIVNGVINQDDTRGALSADSRVFILSQWQNLKNMIGNVYRTENVDYQHAIRPLIQFMGGNGLLQYAQMANNLSGMTNEESAINERINVANYLRAVGRDLKLNVIPTMQSGQGISNEVTPFIAKMELASYNDDFSEFQDAFAEAVQTYREIHPKIDDPQAGVIRLFQSRHPLKRVFRSNPTEGEYRSILENLNDNGREAVESGVRLFNKYLLKLGATPFEGKVEKQGASKAYRSAEGIMQSQLNAANAAYSSSFLD
jgi:hypothetical protein